MKQKYAKRYVSSATLNVIVMLKLKDLIASGYIREEFISRMSKVQGHNTRKRGLSPLRRPLKALIYTDRVQVSLQTDRIILGLNFKSSEKSSRGPYLPSLTSTNYNFHVGQLLQELTA